MNNRLNKQSKSILFFFVGPIFASAIGFLNTPIISYFISPEEYSNVNYFQMVQGIIQAVIYLGFDQAYARFFYDEKEHEYVFSNAILVPLGVSVVCGIGIFLNAERLSELLYSNSERVFPTLLLAFSLPLLVLERFFLLRIRMHEKGLLYSSLNIIAKVLCTAFTVTFFVFLEKSFYSAMYGALIGQNTFDFIVIAISAFGKDRIKWGKIETEKIKDIARFGLPLAPIDLIALILNSADRICIKKFSTALDLGLYGVALRIVGLITIIRSCFISFWTPLSMRWYSEGKDNSDFFRIIEMVTAVLSVVCILVISSKSMIFKMLNTSYRDAQYIFPFLVFYPILYTIAETYIVGMKFVKKGQYLTYVSLAVLILNISLNVLLTPSMGAIGAALTTAVSNIVYFLTTMYIARRCWYSFPYKKILLVMSILVVDALCNVFIRIWPVYVIDLASLIIVWIIYRNRIMELLSMIGVKRILK